jgi:WS/DGAT/MGAT family acyltransferase
MEVDRATPDDVVSLATDVGPVPMQVGAVLVADGALDVDEVTARVAERITAVPRLRQRLVRAPFGGGRPFWVDHAAFDVGEHVGLVPCPAPADEDALLAVAATVIGSRLPRERPLWRVVVVPGLSGSRSGLVVVFHHVLADGIGGLAVLANLVDGPSSRVSGSFPRPAPGRFDLMRDAMSERVDGLRHLGTWVGRVRAAIAQLRPADRAPAQASSLNRPTGPRRRLRVVRCDLGPLHDTAREQGATVNDVLLTAVTGALHELLAMRGESVAEFVVSVPMSARRQASLTELGNEVGVVPVRLPGVGEPVERLAATAAVTRSAKETTRAASTAVLGPVFRVLARLGVFGWFVDRQHLVHTFVTNLRGPDARLSFLDRPIVDVLPVALITGNVTVSFAALSYAGTLVVTVVADPDACPDLDDLRRLLQDQLAALAARGSVAPA